jgi:hypothetical protein
MAPKATTSGAIIPTPNKRREDESRGEDLDALLGALDPRYVERRAGAWLAFRSDHPDRLSQAANSMVEILDKVITQKCVGTTVQAFLVTRFSVHQQTDWVVQTRAWIGSTKGSLQFLP